MKILFTYDYGKEKMQMIRDLGYDLIIRQEAEITNDDEVNKADILVCYNPFDKLDISQMKNLKFIQLSSIGIDQLPIDKLKDRDIIISNNRGGYSIPMGEWIVLKILEIYKNSRYFYESQNNKNWKINTDVLELYGSKVGFLGTGTIAKEAAKRLNGFGVKKIGLNTRGINTGEFDFIYSIDQIEEFLKEIDVLVVALPHTKKTDRLLDYEKLSLMKDNASIINISRGRIINENDLITLLKDKKFIGVALDVFEEEPLKAESELWDIKRVLISPHNSWISQMRNERRFEIIYENLKKYLDSKEVSNIVDVEKGY